MLTQTIQNRLAPIVATLAALTVLSLALSAVLLFQLRQAQDDLTRVEEGTAFFALQFGVLRNQLAELQPALSAGLDEAVSGLESMDVSAVDVTVAIDETLDFEATIPIETELVVPIEAVVPIRQSLDTTIEVQGPLGLAVPVSVTVPINLDIPVSTTVQIPINESLPFAATVPVQIDAPLRVDLGGTGLTAVTDALLAMLVDLQEALSGVSQ